MVVDLIRTSLVVINGLRRIQRDLLKSGYLLVKIV